MKMCAINLYDYPEADYRGHVGSVCITQAFDAAGWETKNYCRFGIDNRVDEIVAEDFDVVYMNITNPIEPLLCVIDALSHKTKVLTYTDGLADHLEYFMFDQRPKYIEIMNKSNLVLSTSDEAKRYLEQWTSTKIESIGSVVNYKLITDGVKSGKYEREEDLVLCGYLYHRPDRSTMHAIKVCKNLHLRALLVQFDEKYKYEEILCDMGLDNVVIVKATAQKQYLNNILSRASYSMFLPTRATLGRTAAECACIGIPSIGTPSYFQSRMFPNFTINSIYDTEDMLRFVSSSYSNHAVQSELDNANKRIKEYNPLPYGVELCRLLDVPVVRWSGFGNTS